MTVYILIGEYERSLMSEVFGAFDTEEKAITYIHNNFEHTEYCETTRTWTAEVFHDTVELRIVRQEVQ